VRERE